MEVATHSFTVTERFLISYEDLTVQVIFSDNSEIMEDCTGIENFLPYQCLQYQNFWELLGLQ